MIHLFLMASLLLSCIFNNVECVAVKKPLTFLVYIAGDNNLSPYIADDLKEMSNIGSNNYVNILAYVCTKERRKKITKKLFIQKNKVTEVGSEKGRDSGSEQTVIAACQWACTSYPSDHFVIVFWNHGSGSLNRDKMNSSLWWQPEQEERAVCYDDTTGSYLTDAKLRTALAALMKMRGGKKADVVAFDACLMADIEVAYTLQDYAHYVVGSQENIPGTGYGYDYVLGRAAQGEVDPRTFAINMVDAYRKEYMGIVNDYTLSAVDLSVLPLLMNNVNHISNLLIDMLKKPSGTSTKAAIKASCSLQNCTHMSSAYYIDLGHFYRNLLVNVDKINTLDIGAKAELRSYLTNALDLLNKAVVAHVEGSDYPYATGLSIYFDQNRIDSTYPTLYWSKTTAWYPFLKQYFATTSGGSLLGLLG